MVLTQYFCFVLLQILNSAFKYDLHTILLLGIFCTPPFLCWVILKTLCLDVSQTDIICLIVFQNETAKRAFSAKSIRGPSWFAQKTSTGTYPLSENFDMKKDAEVVSFFVFTPPVYRKTKDILRNYRNRINIAVEFSYRRHNHHSLQNIVLFLYQRLDRRILLLRIPRRCLDANFLDSTVQHLWLYLNINDILRSAV